MSPEFQGKNNYPLPRLFGGAGLGCQQGFSFAAAVQTRGVSPKGSAGGGEGVAGGGGQRPGLRSRRWLRRGGSFLT